MEELLKTILRDAGETIELSLLGRKVPPSHKLRIGLDVSNWIGVAREFNVAGKGIYSWKLAEGIAQKIQTLQRITSSSLLVVLMAPSNKPNISSSHCISSAEDTITICLMNLLREKQLPFIVAPESLEAQLSYLEKTRLIDFVISSGTKYSHLLGVCQNICYLQDEKLVQGVLLKKCRHLGASLLMDFSPTMISILRILTGADPKCPVKIHDAQKACKLVRSAFYEQNVQECSPLWKIFVSIPNGSDESYVRPFLTALIRSCHSVVACPLRRKFVRIAGKKDTEQLIPDPELLKSSLYLEICRFPHNYPDFVFQMPPSMLHMDMAEGWVDPLTQKPYQGLKKVPAMVEYRVWVAGKMNPSTSSQDAAAGEQEEDMQEETSTAKQNDDHPSTRVASLVELTDESKAQKRTLSNLERDSLAQAEEAALAEATQFVKNQLKRVSKKRALERERRLMDDNNPLEYRPAMQSQFRNTGVAPRANHGCEVVPTTAYNQIEQSNQYSQGRIANFPVIPDQTWQPSVYQNTQQQQPQHPSMTLGSYGDHSVQAQNHQGASFPFNVHQPETWQASGMASHFHQNAQVQQQRDQTVVTFTTKITFPKGQQNNNFEVLDDAPMHPAQLQHMRMTDNRQYRLPPSKPQDWQHPYDAYQANTNHNGYQHY